jgi:hypothetical protein
VYHDERPDAGHLEYCELHLDGLVVRDGPSRFWFSEGHLGSEGAYQNGRSVGVWKECDRFDHCRTRTYELLRNDERRWGATKREIPLSRAHGKFVFDFGSCWSTYVRLETPDVEVGVTRLPFKCIVGYGPTHDARHGHVLCRVPSGVGKREVDSVDLMTELPKLGLPQFCRSLDTSFSGEMLLVSAREQFIDPATLKETSSFFDIATGSDVECATLPGVPTGQLLLTLRFNPFVEKLLTEAIEKAPTQNVICYAFENKLTSSTVDARGRHLFTFALSPDILKTQRGRDCLTTAFTMRTTCASP